jgi:putative flavoprotein involved in K+ transport
LSGEPRQVSGLVDGESGLFFVGQHFQHSVSSTMIHGVGRDAALIVRTIAKRRTERVAVVEPSSRSLAGSRAHVA